MTCWPLTSARCWQPWPNSGVPEVTASKQRETRSKVDQWLFMAAPSSICWLLTETPLIYPVLNLTFCLSLFTVSSSDLFNTIFSIQADVTEPFGSCCWFMKWSDVKILIWLFVCFLCVHFDDHILKLRIWLIPFSGFSASGPQCPQPFSCLCNTSASLLLFMRKLGFFLPVFRVQMDKFVYTFQWFLPCNLKNTIPEYCWH